MQKNTITTTTTVDENKNGGSSIPIATEDNNFVFSNYKNNYVEEENDPSSREIPLENMLDKNECDILENLKIMEKSTFADQGIGYSQELGNLNKITNERCDGSSSDEDLSDFHMTTEEENDSDLSDFVEEDGGSDSDLSDFTLTCIKKKNNMYVCKDDDNNQHILFGQPGTGTETGTGSKKIIDDDTFILLNYSDNNLNI